MARERKSAHGPQPQPAPDNAPPQLPAPGEPGNNYDNSAITIDGVDLEELLKSRQKIQAKAWLLYGDKSKGIKPGVERFPQEPGQSEAAWCRVLAEKAIREGVPAASVDELAETFGRYFRQERTNNS
jgi:hypothetical protein